MSSLRQSPRSNKRVYYEEYHSSESDDLDYLLDSGDESKGKSRRSTLRSRKRKMPSFQNLREQVTPSPSPEPPPTPTDVLSPRKAPTYPKKKHRRPFLRSKGSMNPNSKSVKTVVGLQGRHQNPGRLMKHGHGVIPKWNQLPYHILLQIFEYAVNDLIWQFPLPAGIRHCSNSGWLLEVALLCKGFTEPALATLYSNPSFTSLVAANDFVKALESDIKLQSHDYRTKVKKIVISVEQIQGVQAMSKTRIDLSRLIKVMPQVKVIEIFDANSVNTFTHTINSRWFYPHSIFHALENAGIKLKQWRWSSLLITPKERSSLIYEINHIRAFQSLKVVTLAHFGKGPSSLGRNEVEDNIFIASINALTHLESLTLESCPMVAGDLLNGLEQPLKVLKLIDCANLKSKMIAAFLPQHGSSISELVLDHNAGLDLSFLTTLKEHCPNLKVLQVDMYLPFQDNLPSFEAAIGNDDKPTWPVSLRSLNLHQIKKWEKAGAETLFRSLLQSSTQLKDLRTLQVNAVLSLPVRERVDFRREWVDRFEKVFLRRPSPPSNHLCSLEAWGRYKEAQKVIVGEHGLQMANGAVTKLPRRSNRFSDANEDDSNARKITTESTGNDSVCPRQCDMVEILVDNSKQTSECKFTEDDFLDSEPSGDESYDDSVGIVMMTNPIEDDFSSS
ncbi:MAG: hypothetical protein M1814_003350 [Vezdaea aestivalis]|nr:MAG: hypothetical protein M1814_003350 [Vezdaea aestivalis]